jgi:2'-5' RNA ligase
VKCQHVALKYRYDQLWKSNIDRIGSGAIEIDPVLAERRVDLRRGLTMIIRPSEPVRQQVAKFLEEVRGLEPDQYYYDPSELHVTFLALFTATVDHRKFLARAEDYTAAVSSSLGKIDSFSIKFAGLTVSPGGILIQGFTECETLNDGRDKLRRDLQARGLGESLDKRYRLETAHMTAVRFRHPLRNGKALVNLLECRREMHFGETQVEVVELVKNDWYMSQKTLELIQVFKLNKG